LYAPPAQSPVVGPPAAAPEIVDERCLAAYVRELTVVGLRAIPHLRRWRPEQADEVVSDALVRLWNKYGAALTRRELHLLKREMVRIARNLAINLYKSELARRKHEDSRALGGIEPPATPSEEYEQSEFLQVYERTVADMPDALRDVWLASVDGIKPAQIAVRYGLSPGAVEKRRQRADAFIRPRIEAAGYRWLPKSSKAAKDAGQSEGNSEDSTAARITKGKKVAEPPPPRYDATGRPPADEEEEP
jgi:RNA polymerase sigma factor (sigma-70 family)